MSIRGASSLGEWERRRKDAKAGFQEELHRARSGIDEQQGLVSCVFLHDLHIDVLRLTGLTYLTILICPFHASVQWVQQARPLYPYCECNKRLRQQGKSSGLRHAGPVSTECHPENHDKE